MPESAISTSRTKTPLIVAHRGNSRQAPENTLPAFASAVRLGVDLVELDYFDSADGHPVVFHDRALSRTTDAQTVLGRGDQAISSLTLDQVRQLDAGSWFSEAFGGTKIPTLDEALDKIHEGSRALIECKAGNAETCINLLRSKDLVDTVVVQSFDWDYLRCCRRIESTLTLAALGDGQLSTEKLDEIEELEAAIVGWHHQRVGTNEIASIHRRGLQAWAFTVNDSDRALQLIDDGIDAIISDIPAVMLRLRDG